jgi:DNA-binding transcriptional ArsR family regulator
MNLRRDVFQAIADPTRRAILLLLAAQSLPAGAIAARFESARPTISRHLQILTECDLLQAKPRGREVYYQLNPAGMKDVSDFLEPFRKLWDERFDKLEALMKSHL